MVFKIIWGVIKNLLIGLGTGIAIALALYALGFVLEVLNCTCHIVTCNCQGGDLIPIMWSWESFFTVVTFSTAGCAIIGAIAGFFIGLQEIRDIYEKERREAARAALEHRQKNLKELKNELERCRNNILNNKKSVLKYKFPFKYESAAYSNAAYNALAKAYEDNAVMQQIIEAEINRE